MYAHSSLHITHVEREVWLVCALNLAYIEYTRGSAKMLARLADRVNLGEPQINFEEAFFQSR